MNGNVLIIAEAGVNHNGSIELAYQLVDKAKEVGADIVKFQTAKSENVISRFAPKADYQKKTTGADGNQLDMVKKLVLPYDDFSKIKEYCNKIGIEFLSTPFDLESIDFLKELECRFWKIPSGEITNYPYLIKIAQTGMPIIMSTGMASLGEIRETVGLLRENGCGELFLLQCTTEYPAPLEDVNLRAMDTLRREFGCEVGYSDHTPGIEIPVAAVAMGAVIIEKHLTLDRDMEGPDHKASLEPDEFAHMVTAIRNVEKAMGSGEKRPAISELKNIDIARKSIVAAIDIDKGEVLTEDNITTKRPGNGISPMRWNDVIGTRAIRKFSADELIEL